MGWLLILGSLVLILTAIAPDGLPDNHQPRRPSPALQDLPRLENPTAQRFTWNPFASPAAPSVATPEDPLPPASTYRYVLVKRSFITITRRALDLGIRISTLIFTLIYSTSLFLLTTSPEELTAGLEDLLSPLRRLGWPITEIMLTLTLALRFIPLVLEEVQNLVRSIWTRAINWKKLGLRQGAKVWLQVAERLLLNLLLRAEQIAGAIQVRGFTEADRHRVPWHDLKLQRGDGLAILGLTLLVVGRCYWGGT